MGDAGTLRSLQMQKKGETYAAYCDRLEEAIKKIVESKDTTTKKKIKILAFALMEAPADFDYGSSDSSFQKVKNFLSTQDSGIRNCFEKECSVLPRKNIRRINYLLGKT